MMEDGFISVRSGFLFSFVFYNFAAVIAEYSGTNAKS